MKAYVVYLHRASSMTPEVRIVSCRTEQDLPETILVESATWPMFDLLEVYDHQDRRLFAVTHDDRAFSH